MKQKYKNRLINVLVVCIMALVVCSCEYQDIADADYPGQSIYLPVAYNGIYALNDTTPTGAKVFRYELDIPNNKFIVPLSVYRSGTNNDGTVHVDITVNNDTINTLIASGEMIDNEGRNFQLIPEDKYTIDPSVTIGNGEEWKGFQLKIDLQYISTQADKRLALAVVVASSEIPASPTLGTVIIVIDTRFLVPTPHFNYSISKSNDKTILFDNQSSYALTYLWNFGDGTTSTKKNPDPHAYADYTTYPISLTVTGITGIPETYETNIRIWENVSTLYLKNPGNPNPFTRSDTRTSRTGNLADWITTDNLKALSGGQLYGGFYNDATLGTVMDLYSRNPIINGKIYQTTRLPQGTYRITFDPVKFEGTNNCYFVLCYGATMPDIEQIAGNSNILIGFNWTEPIELQEFEVNIPAEQDVTIGFVVSTPAPATGRINEIFIKSVGLYK